MRNLKKLNNVGNIVNNVLLDIAGWGLVALGIIKLWKLEGADIHVWQILPWALTILMGAGLVGITIGAIGSEAGGWFSKIIDKVIGNGSND